MSNLFECGYDEHWFLDLLEQLMNTLIICLIIAILITYFSKFPLAYAMKQTGSYDNNYPRIQAASLKGFGSRAYAAHKNSFEALTVFATAVLTALATNHLSEAIQLLAIVYLVSRVMYHVFYLMDWATLRSSIWAFGLVCCLAILCLCMD